MVVVYHGWTTSHHCTDHLITSNSTVLFSNPSDRPIGSFEAEANRRFHIENLCGALLQTAFNACRRGTDKKYRQGKLKFS